MREKHKVTYKGKEKKKGGERDKEKNTVCSPAMLIRFF